MTTYKAAVQSSFKSILRTVCITIRKDNHAIAGECDCPVGRSRCSHMAAVLLHVHRSVSCTDTLATWSQKGPIEYETQTLEEMMGANDSTAVTLEDKLKIQDTTREYLSGHHFALPAGWLLKEEPDEIQEEDEVQDEEELQCDLGKIVMSAEFTLCDDKRDFLERICTVTEEEIREISEKTVGQWQNPVYLKYKPFRLTASNFGHIIQAVSRNSYPPSLFGRLLNTSNLSGVKAIQWGCQNESTALRVLREHYSNLEEIQSTGLHLHPCGVLGASPDGISNSSVTEIKCPYTWRNDDLREALIYKVNKPRTKKEPKNERAAKKVAPVPLKIRKNTYIVYILDGKLHINKEHPYYSQIQAQIYFCKKEYANFFIWTTKSHLLLRIPKDPAWECNIDILQNFYYNTFIPYILSDAASI